MKKTILTALLAIFVMAGFANNNIPLKHNVKKVTIVKELDKKQHQENKSHVDMLISKPSEDAPCFEATLSCGLTGWFCGPNLTQMFVAVKFAEKLHCTFN